ncbi:glycogen debranching N-terminal domain-containing protein [Nostocoides vanveenii]|uniref:Glycogen debranching N-terminal domain-containing protein n=3 Tax=Nostocoides TaxID=99479 RepID=A0ABP4WIH2_9MICO
MTKISGRQPWLHDRTIAVCGNATALSVADGSMGATGTGLLVDDRLVLSELRLRLAGEEPAVIQSGATGAVAAIWSCARNLGDSGPDPTVEVHRRREVVGGGMRERIRLISRAADPVLVDVEITLGGTGAELAVVKGGHPQGPVLPISIEGPALRWIDDRHETTVRTVPVAEVAVGADGLARLTWPVELSTSVPVDLVVEIDARRVSASAFDADAGTGLVDWSGIEALAVDRRIGALVSTSLRDLQALLLTDPLAPSDVFAGAGTPWYLTLFGRDSLWAARLMLPFDLALAGGTLRTLARRQGHTNDPVTAEEPGKILHEVRRAPYVDKTSGMVLPPVYYGTVDATALWAIVLHDAWRQGLDTGEVRALLPNLQAAMGWLQQAADNELGLLRYIDRSGSGLANQGWKDSGDSMRRRDGSIAPAPIALVEAQAYAVEAAYGAAAIYEAFGVPGADAVRAWGVDLAGRINERYWVEDDRGSYLAMAIDGDGRPVDGVGSNMGHVLGTGVLDEGQARLVVDRLLAPDLLGEFGIGTLSRTNPAYNPIGYHTGSVWTHDTAIALLGMVREGQSRAASQVARGLVAVTVPLNYRAPELFAGESVAGLPAPYPASCRPQAWSAASAAAIVAGVLGLAVDVPGRRVSLRPMSPPPFGPMRVTGLRFGATSFGVEIDAEGETSVTGLPVDVAVDIS